MPVALALVAAAAALSPLFTDLNAPSIAVSPSKAVALSTRWLGKPVAVRLATAATHNCGSSPWLYGASATVDDRCTRVATVTVAINGVKLPVPAQSYAVLGNVTHVLLQPTKGGVALYLRGAEGGAEDYGATLIFDRTGLVQRRIYWPDGTAERTTYTMAD